MPFCLIQILLSIMVCSRVANLKLSNGRPCKVCLKTGSSLNEENRETQYLSQYHWILQSKQRIIKPLQLSQ